jgi:hypothetical protein
MSSGMCGLGNIGEARYHEVEVGRGAKRRRAGTAEEAAGRHANKVFACQQHLDIRVVQHGLDDDGCKLLLDGILEGLPTGLHA